MEEFLEFDGKTETLKSINLDDLSIEELKEYIVDLKKEIQRVNLEVDKKNKVKLKAEKIFK